MAKFFIIMATLLTATSAMAGSYWNHNGSIMYLEAYGSERIFTYDKPTVRMQKAGVTSGTLYFNGARRGNTYHGTARVFSKYCAYPIEYPVTGRVVSETKIVLTGTRKSYGAGCRPNGKVTSDTLVFEYLYSD